MSNALDEHRRAEAHRGDSREDEAEVLPNTSPTARRRCRPLARLLDLSGLAEHRRCALDTPDHGDVDDVEDNEEKSAESSHASTPGQHGAHSTHGQTEQPVDCLLYTSPSPRD